MIIRLGLCLFLLLFAMGCGGKGVVVTQDEAVLPSSQGASISGKVLDPLTGRPIEGVRVELGDKEAETDEDGMFSITGIQAEGYTIRFTKDGYAAQEVSFQGDSIEVYMYPVLEVEGEVIDGSSGNPLEGVYVGFGDISNPIYTFTDSKGSFRLEIPIRSFSEIYGTAYKRGYLPQALSIKPGDERKKFFKITLYPRTCGCG
jgi:5-hydroxyisourate hydrolase-like protein (transthyretin family)